MAIAEFVQALFVLLQEHPLGLVYYTLFLGAWTMCCLPTTPVEIAAGFTWSTASASAASSVGKTLGSCSAFAISRLLLLPVLSRSSGGAHGPLRQRVRRGIDAFFSSLGSAIRTQPFWTVGLIRAAPLPIALKNYGLGLSPELPGSVFCLMTLLVNIPFSIAWALTGSSASSLQEAVQSGDAGSSSGEGRLAPNSLALRPGGGTEAAVPSASFRTIIYIYIYIYIYYVCIYMCIYIYIYMYI